MDETKGDGGESDLEGVEANGTPEPLSDLHGGLQTDMTPDATTDPEGPRKRKAKKLVKGEADLIKNVSIADAATGIVLVEKIYRWPETAKTEMLGSLVQALYQFAREVDDGNISSVNFETHVPYKHRQPSSGFRAPKTVKAPSESMKMLCTRGSVVTVSVFFDLKGGHSLNTGQYTRLNDYLQLITRGFEDEFTQTLEACRDEVKTAAEAPTVDPAQIQRIRSRFSSYESTIETLRMECFKSEPSSSSGAESLSSFNPAFTPTNPHTQQPGHRRDVSGGSSSSKGL